MAPLPTEEPPGAAFVFDEKGNPYPRDLIEISLAEVERLLVDGFPESVTRKGIYSGYLRYLNDFSIAVCPEWTQWLNGSFTTAKIDPQDIDVVNFVDFRYITPRIERFLTPNHGKNVHYPVDGYLVQLFPQNDERFLKITCKRLQYWRKWFGNDRLDNKKGIMQVKVSPSDISHGA
ncbi:MAG: hypothetical protein GYA56_06415 [Geobacteraceae bacterium]|nr:hypothetical protein [Geobacteraceae bacterium]